MTVVADLVARLRAENQSFDAGYKESEQVLHQFGTALESSGEHLLRVRDIAGTVALAVGGTLTAGIIAAAESVSTFTKQTEQMQVQFTALLGSSTGANAQIDSIRKFAAEMGIADQAVANTSRSLELFTQGSHDNVETWKSLNDVAVSTGHSVDQVSDQFGRLYQILQRGSGQVGLVTRELVGQGEITQQTANQLTQMAREGKSVDEIWNTLIDSTKRFKGASEQQANTFVNLKQSLKSITEERIGFAFEPVVHGVEEIMKAVKELLESNGIQKFANDVREAMTGITDHLESFVGHIHNMTAAANAGGIDSFIDRLKESNVLVGTLTGLFVEFGAEIVGEMPVLNRFAGPIVGLLEDGRGAMLGFLLSTKETREAVGNLLSSILDLVQAFVGTGSAINSLMEAAAPMVATIVNLTSSVVDFVAEHRQIVDMAVAFIALWEAIKIANGVKSVFVDVVRGLEALWDGLRRMITLQSLHAESTTAQMTAEEQQISSTTALTAAIERLAIAYEQAATAQAKLTGNTLAETEAEITQTATATTNTGAQSRRSGTGRGLAAGAGGMAAGFGFMDLMSGGGGPLDFTAMGAGGFMFGPEVGIPTTIAGGLIDVGRALFELGDKADETASKLRHAQQGVESFNAAHPEDVSNVSNLTDRVSASQQIAGKVWEQMDNARMRSTSADSAFANEKQRFGQTGHGERELEAAESAANAAHKVLQAAEDDFNTASQIVADTQAKLANASQILFGVVQATGSSVDSVKAKIKELGIDVANLDPKSQQGKDGIEQLVNALMNANDQVKVVQDSFGSLMAQFEFARTRVSGATGQMLFDTNTLPKDNRGSGSFTSPLIEETRGQTIQTSAYAEELLQEFNNARAAREANIALADALHGVQNAQFSLNQQALIYNKTVDDQGRQVTEFAAILRGHHNEYYDVQRSIADLAPEHRALGDALLQEINSILSAQYHLQDLQRSYEDQQNQLSVLTDKQKEYQDVLNHPLAGTRAYDDKIQANKIAQEAIQLQISQMKGAGLSDEDPRIRALTDQLMRLKNAGEQLTLQKDLDIGDKQYKLDKLKDTLAEISFDEAKTAATNVGHLATQIDTLTLSSDKTKTEMDTVNQAIAIQKQKIDQLIPVLSQIASQDQALITQAHGLSDAIYSVQKAQQAVVNAYDGITALALQRNVQIAQAYAALMDQSRARAQEDMNSAVATATRSADQIASAFARALASINAAKSAATGFSGGYAGGFGGAVGVPGGLTGSSYGMHQATTNQTFFNWADGGINFFAKGGMYGEPHDARMYSAGDGTRVFNEPETGGEAYIPLGSNKRPQAEAVLQQVLGIFGWKAESGPSMGMRSIPTPVTAPVGIGGDANTLPHMPKRGPEVSHGTSGMYFTIAEGAVKVTINGVDGSSTHDLKREVKRGVNDTLKEILQGVQAHGASV